MTVLVTGGAGFIGSHVVDGYVARGHRVVVVDNLSSGRRRFLNPSARFYPIDIRSHRLAEVFGTERPEAVSHHAAQVNVSRSVAVAGVDARVNILGTLNVLACCRRFGVRRLICASSGAVYGDAPVVPTPEDHPVRPASPFGVSKVAMEHYLRLWSAAYGISGLALRYASVYGPRQNPLAEGGVVTIVARRLLRGEPVIISGDGRQTGDYVYIEDVANANLRALEQSSVTGALNIGSGVETSALELLERMQQAAGSRVQVRHGPPKPDELGRSALDALLARRLLGWAPRVGLDEGLRHTVDHLRQEILRR